MVFQFPRRWGRGQTVRTNVCFCVLTWTVSCYQQLHVLLKHRLGSQPLTSDYLFPTLISDSPVSLANANPAARGSRLSVAAWILQMSSDPGPKTRHPPGGSSSFRTNLGIARVISLTLVQQAWRRMDQLHLSKRHLWQIKNASLVLKQKHGTRLLKTFFVTFFQTSGSISA